MNDQRSALFWADLLLVVVAGAWTLFQLIWNVAGQTADDYWGAALLVLLFLALTGAFVHYARSRATLRVHCVRGAVS